MQPLFEPKYETVLYGDYYQKNDVANDSSEEGGMDWQIIDYKTSRSYSKNFVTNAKLITASICENNPVSYSHEILDTVIDLKGIPATVFILFEKGKKIAEFYYNNEYKVNPSYYSCTSDSPVNYFYRHTKGALILQQVEFAAAYIWIFQAQNIAQGKVTDDMFKIED